MLVALLPRTFSSPGPSFGVRLQRSFQSFGTICSQSNRHAFLTRANYPKIKLNIIRHHSAWTWKTQLFDRRKMLLNSALFRRYLDHAARHREHLREKNRESLYYIVGISVLFGGLSYASVPLYRVFCQQTGFGGTTQVATNMEKIENMSVVEDREFRVTFDSSINAGMAWTFEPQQHAITVRPGETALAFFTATNPTERPIVGISTYNIVPFDAGAYFNKIQCFCFEEQLLNPGEEVDMPVFFYLDPDIATDPGLYGIKDLILSYTFFEAMEGLQLPQPLTPPHARMVPPEFSKQVSVA